MDGLRTRTKRILRNKSAFIVLLMCAALAMSTMASAEAYGFTGAASTGLYEFDGSFAPATGPGDYNGGFGINFGAGYALAAIDKHLQARIDISFYQFKNDFRWGSGSYTRVPITIGARYFVPIADKLRAFGQAGLETSIDTFDNSAHETNREVNFGLAPGAGIEFMVNPKVSVFALAIVHIISDSYVSMQFGVATHF